MTNQPTKPNMLHTYATRSDFFRTLDRTQYGVLTPVEALQRSMDKLEKQMNDWGSFKGFYDV